jgi:hypothetical protein
MDERQIKRLLITLGVAIIIIMLAKYMLTKTYTNLNKVVVEKEKSTTIQQAPKPAHELQEVERVPVTSSSSVEEADSAIPKAGAANP